MLFTDEELAELEAANAIWEEYKVYSDVRMRLDAELHGEIARESMKVYRRNFPRAESVGSALVRAPGDLRVADWDKILSRFHISCAYCGQTHVQLVVEHVVPVSRGGKTDWNNIVPACRHCNSLKGSRDPIVWIFSNRRRAAQFSVAVIGANPECFTP